MTIADAIKTLELAGPVTKAAIKKAFRRAAHIHHPDKRGSAEVFAKAKQAYDTLMALSPDELDSLQPVASPAAAAASYDPFADPNYSRRHFFTPDNPRVEGFERKLRAHGCPHCHGIGTITHNTRPEKGFLGLETRLCRCQWA